MRSTARAHWSLLPGIARGFQRLELGERRPLRIDRQAPAVGKHQAELDHAAVHPEV
jgi:hypothetical protein